MKHRSSSLLQHTLLMITYGTSCSCTAAPLGWSSSRHLVPSPLQASDCRCVFFEGVGDTHTHTQQLLCFGVEEVEGLRMQYWRFPISWQSATLGPCKWSPQCVFWGVFVTPALGVSWLPDGVSKLFIVHCPRSLALTNISLLSLPPFPVSSLALSLVLHLSSVCLRLSSPR